MNRATITFIATILTSTVGMLFFVILTTVAAIKGWGRFGDSEVWENSLEDDYLEREDQQRLREKDPELYEDIDLEKFGIKR